MTTQFRTRPRPPRDAIEREALGKRESRQEGCRESAPYPQPPFLCTRVHGHEGDHVAAAIDKIVARWAQGEEVKP